MLNLSKFFRTEKLDELKESDTGEDLYALGCKLKNLESHLLNILNKKN